MISYFVTKVKKLNQEEHANFVLYQYFIIKFVCFSLLSRFLSFFLFECRLESFRESFTMARIMTSSCRIRSVVSVSHKS